jgi:hypothetical protein
MITKGDLRYTLLLLDPEHLHVGHKPSIRADLEVIPSNGYYTHGSILPQIHQVKIASEQNRVFTSVFVLAQFLINLLQESTKFFQFLNRWHHLIRHQHSVQSCPDSCLLNYLALSYMHGG